MKSKITLLFLLSLFIVSCSGDDDAKSKQFEFLEFEKDVVLPSLNSGDITFLAIDFDTNLGNWDLKLTDEDGTVLAAVLDRVEDTRIGFADKRIQRVAFKAAPKNEGVYTLVIKNKTTEQVYTDHFIVRSKTFNKINYQYVEDYTILFAHSSNEQEPTQDYIYFHNIKNTIQSSILTSGISGIRLEDVSTFKSYDLEYSINSNTKKVEFIISSGVPAGKYFLSVRYNNLIDTYFEKDIVVQEEKMPVISSINKAAFKGGETMVLKGSNFRYNFNLDLLPGSAYRYYKSRTALVFTDLYGTGEIELSAYESDASFKYMNTQATEVNYPIPVKTVDKFFFFVSDKEATYFEGTVALRTGPYISEPMKIRIDFK